MRLSRRSLIAQECRLSRRSLLATLALAAKVSGQSLFRGGSPLLPSVVFHTTAPAAFNPCWIKTGAVLHWDWGDGNSTDDNCPTHTYSGGAHTVKVTSTDGFSAVTSVVLYNLHLSGTLADFSAFTAMTYFQVSGNPNLTSALPSFAACPLLTLFQCDNCGFSGTMPSFAASTGLHTFHADGSHFTGTLPSFAACTGLFYCYLNQNSFSGTLPSFAACTGLLEFRCNNNGFSGNLPSFNSCPHLVLFDCGQCNFSGTLPDFSGCVALQSFQAWINNFNQVTAGSFATQASMYFCRLAYNALVQSAVDQVLADFVTSLSLPGRVACEVHLEGNTAPSSAGYANKAILNAVSGWAVTTD